MNPKTPVLHLVVGPNGAGKTSLFARVIGPATRLWFVNADIIASERWPGDEVARAYEAAQVAADERSRLIDDHVSFATETVFSHASKLDLVADAIAAGYLVTLHVVLVPEELAVARVDNRAAQGGHAVPEEKIRARFARVWLNVAIAITIVPTAVVYDNSSAKDPFRVVASFRAGQPVRTVEWPAWTPAELRALTD